ncbi:hypothetical protein SGPA1_10422 [Streptomyces misionensis JCM 4497]
MRTVRQGQPGRGPYHRPVADRRHPPSPCHHRTAGRAARTAADGSAGVRPDRGPARRRPVHRGRGAPGRQGGRGPAQRGRQAGGAGPAERRAAPVPDGAAGLRAGLVRAGAEGGDGRDTGAGRRVRAVLAGGGPGRGDRSDARRFPARQLDERVRGRGPDRPAAGGRARLIAGPAPISPSAAPVCLGRVLGERGDQRSGERRSCAHAGSTGSPALMDRDGTLVRGSADVVHRPRTVTGPCRRSWSTGR